MYDVCTGNLIFISDCYTSVLNGAAWLSYGAAWLSMVRRGSA
jgi:hypothetical protein